MVGFFKLQFQRFKYAVGHLSIVASNRLEVDGTGNCGELRIGEPGDGCHRTVKGRISFKSQMMKSGNTLNSLVALRNRICRWRRKTPPGEGFISGCSRLTLVELIRRSQIGVKKIAEVSVFW